MAWTTPGTATAGEVLTAAFWNTNVRDNSLELYNTVRRLAYIERTSNYDTTATTLSTATDVFSSDLTFTADGTSSYLVVFLPGAYLSVNTGGVAFNLYLTDGGNNGLGRMILFQPSGASERQPGGIAQRFYTPAAGSRSLNIRGVVSSNQGTMGANDGTGTLDVPAYLAVYGPILT